MKDKKKKPTVHGRVMSVVNTFVHFLKKYGKDGAKKPNRRQRRAALIGVKIGNNSKMTKARKASGSLIRKRVTLV